MTPQQKLLVRESFERITPVAPAAAARFYDRLFELDPSLRRLFKGDMKAQAYKLIGLIVAAVSNLDHFQEFAPQVRSLGLRHAGYGVKDSDYDLVATALLWTLEQHLGDGFTPSVREAWIACYGLIAGEMKEAAAAGA
jgi:hemoglobin-like flavoprotein